MGVMASQITSLTIVYSTVYSGTALRQHQSSASLAFVRRIHRGRVNSPHKWASYAENISIWWRHHGPSIVEPLSLVDNWGYNCIFNTVCFAAVGHGRIDKIMLYSFNHWNNIKKNVDKVENFYHSIFSIVNPLILLGEPVLKRASQYSIKHVPQLKRAVSCMGIITYKGISPMLYVFMDIFW